MTAGPAFDFPLRLGFGCSGPLAAAWFPARDAERLIRTAFDGGVRHFDTAPFYGDGEAERRLGAALAASGAAAFVSTKTGTRRAGGRIVKDFTSDGIRADVAASLKRLKRERLDLLYLHGPAVADIDGARETLERLKAEGAIARWGVCGAGSELDHAIAAGADAIMAAYNVLDQSRAGILARAKAAGLGVVAIAPLAQGLYRRGLFLPKTPADAWALARALIRNRDALRRAQALAPLLRTAAGRTEAEVALAFVLANPSIDVAVTTTTRPVHLAQSLAAASTQLPADILARLQEALQGEP